VRAACQEGTLYILAITTARGGCGDIDVSYTTLCFSLVQRFLFSFSFHVFLVYDACRAVDWARYSVRFRVHVNIIEVYYIYNSVVNIVVSCRERTMCTAWIGCLHDPWQIQGPWPQTSDEFLFCFAKTLNFRRNLPVPWVVIMQKGVQLQGSPPTPWPEAPSLDPAGGSAPRPYRFALALTMCPQNSGARSAVLLTCLHVSGYIDCSWSLWVGRGWVLVMAPRNCVRLLLSDKMIRRDLDVAVQSIVWKDWGLISEITYYVSSNPTQSLTYSVMHLRS